MPSFYSIIQFVPDPIANERLNAGVIVFDEASVQVRFTRNWDRLKRFSNKDISFLKDFARQLEDRVPPTLFDDRLTASTIRRISATWRNAIQLTPPRGSLLSLDRLLTDAEQRFLTADQQDEGLRRYTRASLKTFSLEAARLAFDRLGRSSMRDMVRSDFPIQGAVDGHKFPLAIANGKPLAAAEMLSFLGKDQRWMEKLLHATAWVFEDVQKKHGELELAAIVVKGEDPPPSYSQAERIFHGIGVKVIQKNEVESWADDIANRVSESH